MTLTTKDILAVLLGGFVIGICTMGFSMLEYGTTYEAKAVIAECQKSLPRDQHCEIVYNTKVVDNEALD